MRKAINENPTVQIALVAGLLLVAALMFLMGPLKKKDEPAATAAGAAPAVGSTASDVVPGAAAPATGAPAAATPAAPATTAPTTGATGTVSPEALIPGPGLPRDVAQAWARGNAIVLLIVKEGARDDELVQASVNSLSKPGVSVFVAPASKVARYSRITQGVGVNRVPALVVVRPRSVSGATPQAIVSYGFRDSQSVVQAVNDALYDGRDDVPYHPG